MTRLRVYPIVEGHGEVNSLRVLLERLWYELLGGEYINVRSPHRLRRNEIIYDHRSALRNALDRAAIWFDELGNSNDPTLILLLLDADDDLACVLGPAVLQVAVARRSDHAIATVVASKEYETWFVAAAASLGEFFAPDKVGTIPDNPERDRCGKKWIDDRFAGGRYSPPTDQPRLTALMDLRLCRERSPSFDKLCRELEKFSQPKT